MEYSFLRRQLEVVALYYASRTRMQSTELDLLLGHLHKHPSHASGRPWSSKIPKRGCWLIVCCRSWMTTAASWSEHGLVLQNEQCIEYCDCHDHVRLLQHFHSTAPYPVSHKEWCQTSSIVSKAHIGCIYFHPFRVLFYSTWRVWSRSTRLSRLRSVPCLMWINMLVEAVAVRMSATALRTNCKCFAALLTILHLSRAESYVAG